MTRLITSLLFSFLLVTTAGCGYTTGSLLPAELSSIHVDNFVNTINPAKEISDRRSAYSYRPGLETDITRAIIDEFIFDRNLNIESTTKAALLLSGMLKDFKQFPLSYDDDGSIEEFRIEIIVDMELFNSLSRELMWKENNFMGQSDYALSGPNAKSESTALTDAIKDLAERVVERTVEAW